MDVDTLLLHRAREERGIDLTAVAARTALNPSIVQSIDSGCFGALPAGVYARSYVRAFARAIGLDADEVVRQLEPSLPRADDPLPVLRELARGPAPDLPDRLSQCASDAADTLGRELIRTVRSLRRRPPARGVSFARFGAACVDAVVLLLLLGSLVQLTAWASGVPGDQVLAASGEQIAVFWGVLLFAYFVILGGVGGRTPGRILSGVPPSEPQEPLTLREIFDRALLQ